MPYCTTSDIEKLIPRALMVTLSNDVNGATEPNAANMAEVIDQADREIDAYLSVAGYSVPMSPVPPLVTNLSIHMAIWNLYLRKGVGSDNRERTYVRCCKLLERIAEGKVNLGELESGVPVTAPSAVVVDARDQRFTDDLWSTF